jgi:superfamily II DNA or RNA helicase
MIVNNFIHVGMDELTASEAKSLERSLTFMMDNGDIVISYRRLIYKHKYILPRGAWYLLPDHVRYEDRRACPSMPKLNFILALDDIARDQRFEGQTVAVEAMFENEQGLIIRPPGTGKTQIALKFAAECETRTLVLVHTKDVMDQWVSYIERSIPELKGQVGVIRGQTCRIGHITVAMVQSIVNYTESKPKEWWQQFGCVIADEAHHVSAPTWEGVLNTCPARYRFGFTASATRADGKHPTMKFIIGPVIHKQKFSSPVKLDVVPVKTEFGFRYRGSFDWGRLLNALVCDEKRNGQIAEVAVREIRADNCVLILSRRIEHLEAVRDHIALQFDFDEGWMQGVKILTSKTKGRRQVLNDFKEGKVWCLLATQLADEALDVQRLNRVCLTHPGKAEGRIIQQVGRALRTHPDKKDAIIYDFIDTRVSVLRRQWGMRKRAYGSADIPVRKQRRLRWR